MPASDPADVAAISVNVVPVMQMENLGGAVDLSLPSFLPGPVMEIAVLKRFILDRP